MPTTSVGMAPAARALTLDDLRREHPDLVESIRREQTDEIVRLRQEVDRLTALEATEQKRSLRGGCCASSICPTRRRPSRGRKPSSAAGSSNRSWRQPTSRRCGPWWKSGHSWCGRWPAMAPRAAAKPRPQSRDQHLVQAARPIDARVLWKRLRK